jgi:TPP-dependent pyruvate/acetoin dehydrogenase alpha subunit
VENNQYAVSTRIKEAVKVEDLSIRAKAYGIPGVRVNGFDVLAVYDAAVEAVERARRGEGPTLLVTESYRFEGHYAGEPEVYRERAEVQEWCKQDPICLFRKHLVEEEEFSQDEVAAIDVGVEQEMAAALKFAKDSPDPELSTAMDFIYA